MKTFAQVAIAFLLCSISLEAQANVGQEGIFVIEGGTVVVGDGQQFEGSILIRNGRIVDVGTSVAVPEGAVTIDASGQFVYAGMIDSY
ncbi:MAG TPA: amidohydrolase, partial [Gemmatimonadetes bacterium]|nr:amidohydrolase [Gemmatimonadota bacterium]